MHIVLQDFRQEFVQKGRNGYTKGTAVYTTNGQQREQNILSFANPTVFAALKEAAPGMAFNVDVTKNAQGYNEWSKLTPANTESGPPTTKSASSAATRTTYETPEERAKRQVLIVRQSSLSAAVSMLSPGAKSALDLDAVLKTAQTLSDWVFENDELKLNNPGTGGEN